MNLIVQTFLEYMWQTVPWVWKYIQKKLHTI